ncbi:MAG: hypothetical protein NDI61_02630 [Bdellovibrionaceae bacterium]|nr:hypothetical protein [Pseudobdellovibrionaceae bacterium]
MLKERYPGYVRSEVVVVGSLQCRNSDQSYQCYVTDASTYGTQLIINDSDAKSVFDLLSSVLRAPSFYENAEGAKTLAATSLRCIQSKREGYSLEERTACYATLGRANKSDLSWGNSFDFIKLANEDN